MSLLYKLICQKPKIFSLLSHKTNKRCKSLQVEKLEPLANNIWCLQLVQICQLFTILASFFCALSVEWTGKYLTHFASGVCFFFLIFQDVL